MGHMALTCQRWTWPWSDLCIYRTVLKYILCVTGSQSREFSTRLTHLCLVVLVMSQTAAFWMHPYFQYIQNIVGTIGNCDVFKVVILDGSGSVVMFLASNPNAEGNTCSHFYCALQAYVDKCVKALHCVIIQWVRFYPCAGTETKLEDNLEDNSIIRATVAQGGLIPVPLLSLRLCARHFTYSGFELQIISLNQFNIVTHYKGLKTPA